MPRYLTIRFDVTGLTPKQVDGLRHYVMVQAESNRKQCDDEEYVYPDVPVTEICHFCSQPLVEGQCGGEGEGICTERQCVEDFAHLGMLSPTYGDDVAAYVRDWCAGVRHRELARALPQRRTHVLLSARLPRAPVPRPATSGIDDDPQQEEPTVNRYRIRYRDDSPESPIFSMVVRAYSKEHAEDLFYDDDLDGGGWVVVSIERL